MALEISPRFTVSMRGYDKEEVERYLATVSERSSQSEDQLYELQEQNRYLEEEHERLATRVEELEVAIRSETPHTVGALGERITLILNEAEEGASETLARAKADAERLVAQAQVEADTLRRQAGASASEAADTLVAARRQAEDLAQRLEMEAKARASSILNDAEHRAQRRQDQIEKWAQEMIAHTQSEQTRMADEFAMVRREHEAEVRTLTGDRDDAIAALRALQASLAQAVDRVIASRPRMEGPVPGDAAPAAEAIDLTGPHSTGRELPGRDPVDRPSIEAARSGMPVGQLASGSGSTSISALSPGARFIDEDDEQSLTGPSPVLGLTDPSAGGSTELDRDDD